METIKQEPIEEWMPTHSESSTELHPPDSSETNPKGSETTSVYNTSGHIDSFGNTKFEPSTVSYCYDNAGIAFHNPDTKENQYICGGANSDTMKNIPGKCGLKSPESLSTGSTSNKFEIEMPRNNTTRTNILHYVDNGIPNTESSTGVPLNQCQSIQQTPFKNVLAINNQSRGCAFNQQTSSSSLRQEPLVMDVQENYAFPTFFHSVSVDVPNVNAVSSNFQHGALVNKIVQDSDSSVRYSLIHNSQGSMIISPNNTGASFVPIYLPVYVPTYVIPSVNSPVTLTQLGPSTQVLNVSNLQRTIDSGANPYSNVLGQEHVSFHAISNETLHEAPSHNSNILSEESKDCNPGTVQSETLTTVQEHDRSLFPEDTGNKRDDAVLGNQEHKLMTQNENVLIPNVRKRKRKKKKPIQDTRHVFMSVTKASIDLDKAFDIMFEELDDKTFKCHKCGGCYASKDEARDHMLIHRPFRCTICYETFPSIFELKVHRNIHEIRYACNRCMFTTFSKYELRYHKEHEHTIDGGFNNPWMCDLCGLVFKTVTQFQSHMQQEHTCKSGELRREGDLECPFCPHLCSNISNFRNHIKEYIGNRLTCPDEGCGFTSSSSNRMERHADRHNNVKRYPCSYDGCNMSFVERNGLDEHVNVVHVRDRKYTCDFCNKGFLSKKHLRVHLRIHSDSKPVACEYCEYRCRQRASLDWHMNKQHADKVSEYASRFKKPRKENYHQPGRKPRAKKLALSERNTEIKH